MPTDQSFEAELDVLRTRYARTKRWAPIFLGAALVAFGAGFLVSFPASRLVAMLFLAGLATLVIQVWRSSCPRCASPFFYASDPGPGASPRSRLFRDESEVECPSCSLALQSRAV